MGIDFNKLNPEEAQKIINALKDGRINDNEAKDLKLTKAEQEALNEAFSSGEVQVGDTILVNKGKSKDGRMQYFEEKKAETKEEQGFWEKATNKLKQDAAGYVKNFKNAWNNSSGAIDTAKSLVGAAGETVKDFVGDAADNVEKGVTNITGSDAAGKWVRGMSAPGLADAILDATQGDYEGIKNVGSSIGKTLAAPFAVFSSCSYNINQEVNVPITLAGAIDAILKGQEVSNQLLAKILEREIQNGTTLEEIKELIGENTEILNTIIDAMVDGNKLLTDIKNSITTGQEDILETLVNIKNSINVITDLIAGAPDYSQQLEDIKNAISQGNQSSQEIMAMLEKLFEQVVKNGDTQIDISAKLDEIKNSSISDGEKLAAMLELLKNIDSTTQDINNKLDEIKNTITEINNKFENAPDLKAALDKLLELVSENNDKADITNQLLEKLISMYENGNGSISKDDITDIINAINKNGEKIDATNQLLAKMQDQDEKFQAQVLKLLGNVGTDYTDVLNKILDAVNNGNAKLDDITKLLDKMQNQDLEFQKNILNAIDKFGTDISNKLTQILTVVEADKDTGKNIEELLNKVLANMDSNTAKIIDAIANIKIEGGGSGNVDLSSVEAMLKELIELTKDNNNALTNIDGKLDVLNITTQAILDKINVEANKNDERYVKVDAFMKEVLNKLSSASGYDDTKLMEILTKLSNMVDTRLEELLNAIKDHEVHVTVDDITVTCKCECDCGKPHEGILGDLEDALEDSLG